MDPNSTLSSYAIVPLRPDEPLYGIVSALLDPLIREHINKHPQGSLEVHWGGANATKVVVHTSTRWKLPFGTPPLLPGDPTLPTTR